MPPTSSRTSFFLYSAFIVVLFFWKALMPASEYPMRSEQIVSILIDVALLIGLIGFRFYRRALFQPGNNQSTPNSILFGLAFVAGVGTLLIRFASHDAWWTGHLIYTLRQG
jgi:hypothetical protein